MKMISSNLGAASPSIPEGMKLLSHKERGKKQFQYISVIIGIDGKRVPKSIKITTRRNLQAAITEAQDLLKYYPPPPDKRSGGTGKYYPEWCKTAQQREKYLKEFKPRELGFKLPKGISLTVVRTQPKRGPIEFLAVSRHVNGIPKCTTFRISGEDKDFKEELQKAKAKLAEWIAEDANENLAWRGGQKLGINPKSVPESMRFKGLTVCESRPVLIVKRHYTEDGTEKQICLYYPYTVEPHDPLGDWQNDTFFEALDKARKGAAVLHSLDRSGLEWAHKLWKKANTERRRGATIANAIRGFDCMKGTGVDFKSLSQMSHHFEER